MGFDEVTKGRRAAMAARIKRDLARRGITNEDLGGLDSHAEVEADGDGVRVLWWRWTVSLKARAALVYTMDNQDGAELLCDGLPVPEVEVVDE